MYKIYSRPRIRLPKVIQNRGDRGKKISKKMATIIIILIIAFSTMKYVLDAVSPIFDTLCESKAKSIATTVSNEQAIAVMKDYTYEDLFTVEKDANDNITMIKSNVTNMNEITSKIATNIQQELDNKGREDIQIALGSFTGWKLLSGRGPGVKIRISSIGNVETTLKSEFTAEGINQTLHRIYLEVVCNVKVLTPFRDIEKKITNQVLLAENVIVGHIPDNYYNLEGLNKSDALEVVE